MEKSTHAPDKSAFRSVSAYVPLLLSAAALTVVAGYLFTGPHTPPTVIENGVARADEGTAAHLWQIFMVPQLPAILVFAVKWLPRDSRRALGLIGLQVAGIGCAAFPVWYLGL